MLKKTREIPIGTDTIELAALLKWGQVANSGGEAKQLIQAGTVRVNGEIERRRSRKLVPGDRVEINGEFLVVTKP